MTMEALQEKRNVGAGSVLGFIGRSPFVMTLLFTGLAMAIGLYENFVAESAGGDRFLFAADQWGAFDWRAHVYILLNQEVYPWLYNKLYVLAQLQNVLLMIAMVFSFVALWKFRPREPKQKAIYVLMVFPLLVFGAWKGYTNYAGEATSRSYYYQMDDAVFKGPLDYTLRYVRAPHLVFSDAFERSDKSRARDGRNAQSRMDFYKSQKPDLTPEELVAYYFKKAGLEKPFVNSEK